MREPTFYGFFLGHLLARAPLDLITVKRLLIDEEAKHSPLVRGMRVSASPVWLARGLKQTPKMRGEPAHHWDGLQTADMLAGAVKEQEREGANYLHGLETHLRIYRYRAAK